MPPSQTSASIVSAELLAGFVPMSALGEESLQRLAKQAAIHGHPDGSVLFRAGQAQTKAWYLLRGQVRLRDGNGWTLIDIKAGEPRARQCLSAPPAVDVSAVCVGPVEVLIVDAGLLDVLLTWEQTGTCEVAPISEVMADDWMTRLLQRPSFQRLPPANLQALFRRLDTLSVAAGEVVIEQGAAGDYFYVIVEGRCRIAHRGVANQALTLADFGPGDCFGEEALIAGLPRNASATMLTAGTLKRLARSDFEELLNEPLIVRLDKATAIAQVRAGVAQWLDVRLPTEFEAGHVPGSVNLPLRLLRLRASTLDRQRLQVCVCDTGRRGAVAAFLLSQRGISAAVLNGGLRGNWQPRAAFEPPQAR